MTEIRTFRGKYYFLSNFYPCRIVWEGLEYPSSEHAFQAAKTLWPAMREKISTASSPAIAKSYGRRCRLRPDWEEVKLDVMNEILTIKFSNPTLAAKLKATGDATLIEGNTWGDQFWGVCKGHGQNHLGQILMRIRESLIG